MLLGIFRVEFENLPWRSELKSETGSEGMYALWLDNCLEVGFWKSSEKLSSVGGMVLGDLFIYLLGWEMLEHVWMLLGIIELRKKSLRCRRAIK